MAKSSFVTSSRGNAESNALPQAQFARSWWRYGQKLASPKKALSR
jgi:hypothetical protein